MRGSNLESRDLNNRLVLIGIFKASFLIFALLLYGNGQAEPTAERRRQLLELLYQDCGSCHGLTLKGGLGPSLLPDNLKNKREEMLVQTILKGREGTAMPPWQDFLSGDDAIWRVKYLLRHR